MAAELGVSVRTIEVRRSKLMKKMKAESLAELIRMTILAEPSGGRGQDQGPGARGRGWAGIEVGATGSVRGQGAGRHE